MQKTILLLTVIFSQTLIATGLYQHGFEKCQTNPTSVEFKGFTTYNYCDENQRLRYSVEYYDESSQFLKQEIYSENGKVLKQRLHNSDGEHTREFAFKHINDTQFVKTRYSTEPLRKYILEKQLLELNSEVASGTVELKKWIYEETVPHKLLAIDIIEQFIAKASQDGKGFLDSRVVERSLFDDNEQLSKTYKFQYHKESTMGDNIEAFSVFDKGGKKIGYSSVHLSGSIRDIIKSRNLPSSEVQRRLDIYNNKNRTPVAILDSGFDHYHPEITYKLFNSPWLKDPQENSLGWKYLYKNKNNTVTMAQMVHKTHLRPDPYSHGTHTSSIVIKDLDGVGLLGFKVSLGKQEQMAKVTNYLSKNKIRFGNMSFGVPQRIVKKPDGGVEMSALGKAYASVVKLTTDTPNILFTVAAGNMGRNLDKGDYYEYPASFTDKNHLVVGAINTDKLDWSKLSTYNVAKFTNLGSNWGTKSVDVFAPGLNVEGAGIGGGKTKASGTSFAAPLVLNSILKMHEANPSLSNDQLKEIIMKTVSYPNIDQPLPCVSGGVTNPERAIAVAKAMLSNGLSVEDTVLSLRKQEPNGLYGEIQSSEYLLKLQAIWASF